MIHSYVSKTPNDIYISPSSPYSMGRILFTFATLLICLCQTLRVDAAIDFINVSCVPEYGTYAEGSLYQENLNTLLSNLSSQASTRSFYNTTTGDSHNTIHGLYQCRGDLNSEVCTECIQDATKRIVQGCPLFREAVVWYYECFLRYANRSIFALGQTYPGYFTWTTYNVSNYAEFAPVLAHTLNSVIDEAAVMSPRGHFATMEANISVFSSLYCLAQCTPDLNDFNCRRCLTTAKSKMVSLFNTSQWVTIFQASCQLRYDTTNQFYEVLSPESEAPTPLGGPPSKPPANVRLTPPIIGGIAVGATIALLLLIGGIWCCLCRAKPREVSTATAISSQPPPPPAEKQDEDDFGDVEFVQYDFATLKVATNDFSIDNKLGEGGFGVVFMATLDNGREVAIKRLSGNSGQGMKEFMTEAQLVAKLQHRNLVKLLGFCSEGDEKILVYEFLPNTSLDRFLFDPRKRAYLDWDTRYKIILGIARGILYLHEDSLLTIIHRDLKPSNILLDKDMNPKIADFGMARLFDKEQQLGNTSRIIGTHGYMAPEYILTGEYSDKFDVYSFGIIILELVSGQKNRILYQGPQTEDLPIQAWKLWNVSRSFDLMDPTLSHNCSKSEVMRCIHIGLLCVQQNAVHRPTMADVMIMLTGSISLPPPSPPAMSPHHFNVLASSSDDDGRQSNQSTTKSIAWRTNVLASSDDDGRQSNQSTTKSVVWRTDIEQDLYPR